MKITSTVPIINTFTPTPTKPLTNLANTVLLCNNPAGQSIQSSSTFHIYVTRYVKADSQDPLGGVYRALTNLDDLRKIIEVSTSDSAANAPEQPAWNIKQNGLRFNRLAAKSCCMRSDFELFVGKEGGNEIDLRVTDDDNIGGEQAFTRIISPDWGDNDNGCRPLDSNGNTQLRFVSMDINRHYVVGLRR